MSRIIVVFEVKKIQESIKCYNHNLQGFIYSLIKDTPYHHLHDSSKPSFCFSNIFPDKSFNAGEIKLWIISSPDTNLIDIIKDKLDLLISKKINLGGTYLKIKKIELVYNIKIEEGMVLYTSTPVIYRIKREIYQKYNITPKIPYKYLYWKKEYPKKLLLDQFQYDVERKYKHFTNSDRTSLMPDLNLTVTGTKKIEMNGLENKKYLFFGLYLRFNICQLTEEQKNVLKIMMDAGIGQRNCLGFGFVNILRYDAV